MKSFGQAALLVTLSLTGVVWLTQALRFVDFIINRGVSFGSFLGLTLLLIPSLLLFILPFSLLCSALYVYYRLMMDSELLVLSSAGLSRLQIAWPAIKIGALASLCAYFISFYLLPVSYAQFKDMQVYLRDNYASLLLQEDVFNNPVEGLTVYIRDRDRNETLHGIIVHDARDLTRPPVTMMAESGRLIQTPQGPRFILYHGSRQQIDKGKLSLLGFEQYALDINFYSNDARKRPVQPEEMFISQLFHPQASGEEAWYLIVEGHNRVTWPLFSLALTLFSVSLLLRGEHNRRGQWKRIVTIVVASSLVMGLGVGFFNMAMRHPAMVGLMYGNLLAVIGVSFWFLLDERAAGKS
jgi:lipopolysaccharide export system permease protein